MDIVTFDHLKAEQSRVKDTLSADLGLRVHRALSWIECAEEASSDDAKFIFYWIAFNSTYERRDQKKAENHIRFASSSSPRSFTKETTPRP